MPIKVTVGFWATFTGWALEVLLEVLQMRSIALPPMTLEIATYVLIVLIFFGLVMMGWGIIQWARQTRRQKHTIAEKSNDIAELDYNLASLRQEYNSRYLVAMPDLLRKIHRHLQSVAVQSDGCNSDVLFEVLQSWATKTGVKIWYKPKKKINKSLLSFQIFTLLHQFKKVLTLRNDAMMVSLYKLAVELDDKNIGLSVRSTEAYTNLTKELDAMLQDLGSPDAVKYVQRYTLNSYSLNSLLLLVEYAYKPDYMKWIPLKYRTPKALLVQGINLYTTRLLADVVKQIQLYLLGK